PSRVTYRVERARRAMSTLNIVGCGKVGQTLGRLWHESGALEIQDLKGNDASRTARAAEFIGAGRAVANLADMRAADLWLVSVPDSRIGAVADEIAVTFSGRTHASGAAPTAFHCSGFLPAAALAPL